MHEESNPLLPLDENERAKLLLIYGHYDVFPVEGQKGWKTDPFKPVVDGDRIWGRGTGDNKCQHLAQMYGIRIINWRRNTCRVMGA